MKHNKVIYREIQRPRQIWVWVLVLAIALFMWYGFIQQIFFKIPFGDKPAPDIALIVLWLFFGIAFPIVMLGFMKLIVEVRVDGIYIRFTPFHIRYRKFLFKDLEHYELMEYGLLEFGGWGIQLNAKGGPAYTMYGKQGIELKFTSETVVIGTQKPFEVIKAIDSLKIEVRNND